MLRKTAIKNANEIARRLKKLGGLIATPEAGNTCVKLKRVWLFGSTVKGASNPNDIDILFEVQICGDKQTNSRSRKLMFGEPGKKQNAKLDKKYYRSTGYPASKEPVEVALISLRKGLKMVRYQRVFSESDDPEDMRIWDSIIANRIMLWPKNEIDQLK